MQDYVIIIIMVFGCIAHADVSLYLCPSCNKKLSSNPL